MAKRSNDTVRPAEGTARNAPRTPAPGAQRDDTGGDERHERIATAAYFRAERRQFEGDDALGDWLDAEREIDSAAAAGGIQSEASRLAEGPGDLTAPAIGAPSGKAADPEVIAPDEVQRWAAELGVSASHLRVAIERAGPRVSDVRRYLHEHPQA